MRGINMNLVDKLMSKDKDIFKHEETAEIRSKNLSKLLGEDTFIKLKGIDSGLYTSFMALSVDKKGRTDLTKTRDSFALIVVEGMSYPNLKEERLQEHFGAATPKELAKMMFKGSELNDIAAKIGELSGFDSDSEEEEEEVKK